MVNYHDKSGISEVTPAEFVENSYNSSNIIYDTTVPSLIKRKGYPEVGVIYITTISKDPILSNPGQVTPRYIGLNVGKETITARLNMLSAGQDKKGYFETFALMLTRKDLISIAESDSVSFRIGLSRFELTQATKLQIKEIINQ